MFSRGKSTTLKIDGHEFEQLKINEIKLGNEEMEGVMLVDKSGTKLYRLAKIIPNYLLSFYDKSIHNVFNIKFGKKYKHFF